MTSTTTRMTETATTTTTMTMTMTMTTLRRGYLTRDPMDPNGDGLYLSPTLRRYVGLRSAAQYSADVPEAFAGSNLGRFGGLKQCFRPTRAMWHVFCSSPPPPRPPPRTWRSLLDAAAAHGVGRDVLERLTTIGGGSPPHPGPPHPPPLAPSSTSKAHSSQGAMVFVVLMLVGVGMILSTRIGKPKSSSPAG